MQTRSGCTVSSVHSGRMGTGRGRKVGITPVARVKKRISMKAVKIFGKFPRCRGKLAIFKSNQTTSFASFLREGERVSFPLFSFSPSFLFAFFPQLPFSLPSSFPSSLCLSFSPSFCPHDSNTAVVNEPVYFGIHLNRSSG